MEKWNTPIYAFWKPIPTIGYDKGRRYHQFHCFKKSCSKSVKRYLDTSDATSTGNLHRHTKTCWGAEVLTSAMNAGNLDEARNVLSKSKDGSIAEAFKVKRERARLLTHIVSIPRQKHGKISCCMYPLTSHINLLYLCTALRLSAGSPKMRGRTRL